MSLPMSSWLTDTSLSLVARGLKVLRHDIWELIMMYFVTWLYVQPQNSFLIRPDQMDAFIVSNGIISKPIGHLVGTTWLGIWLGKKIWTSTRWCCRSRVR